LSASFQPGVEPSETCAGCHNDNNKQLYNGKAVHTPHGGTFGYPVNGGQWTWSGLEQTELAQKPEQVRQILASWPKKNQDQRLSGEFHALHLYRIRAIGGLPGAGGELSCSSCHKSWGASLDRTTPRQTCGICHNGYTDPTTSRAVIAQDKPNCNSCHVQHVEDKRHWNPSLFSQPPQSAGTQAAHDVSLLARTTR
jgi:formate-dependent nitrite reductase cytochrome c552 subunit